ncbi:MAG TPA: metallophosphoesterase family protein [Chitinophagales bacterium]|nr:metallophosphoesterase family protein [Chitinophagales bacterium]
MNEARRWVIGDIHGCIKTLRTLVEDKIQPGRQDKLIFVGDYVDRGPDSKAVISYVMELRLMGYNLVLLKGNHEDMMLQSVHDRPARKNWFYNGGIETLRSFGARDVSEVPDHFLEFLKSLDYYYVTDGFFIVHAGLNFDIPNPLEDVESMLWIRNKYVVPEKIGNRIIVHGHTPVPLEAIKEAVNSKAPDIDLDGGCVYWDIEGLGNLCALELNTMRLESLKNVDFV